MLDPESLTKLIKTASVNILNKLQRNVNKYKLPEIDKNINAVFHKTMLKFQNLCTYNECRT